MTMKQSYLLPPQTLIIMGRERVNEREGERVRVRESERERIPMYYYTHACRDRTASWVLQNP